MSSIEYAVRHPDGQVTFGSDGRTFSTLFKAERSAEEWDAALGKLTCRVCCAEAGPGVHVVVGREVGDWREVQP